MFDLEELEAKAAGTLLLFKCFINRLAPGRAFMLPHLQYEFNMLLIYLKEYSRK